jgi:ferrous iron transport protein B
MAEAPVKEMLGIFPALSDYSAVHYLVNHESMSFDNDMQERIEGIEKKNGFNHTKIQAAGDIETLPSYWRYYRQNRNRRIKDPKEEYS